jgi:hypothetical protein
VAAAEVLDEGMAAGDYVSGSEAGEPAHRAQSSLQTIMIGFDAIVGVLLGHVQGGRDEFVEHPQVRAGLVGGHLDWRRPVPQGATEEPASGRGVPLFGQQHVDDLSVLVANRPVYVAMGITVDGEWDVLGLWVGPAGGEGAKQWMSMLTELRNRGVADVCIVGCDGLKGLPDAIAAIWPLATVQTCVVHLVGNSLRYASKAHWSKITAELRAVYTAPTVAAAEARFAEFAGAWREKYPAMVGMWERSWPEFVPFLDFPRRDPEADLHHQRHRVAQRPVPPGGPPARALPDRASSPEDPLPHRPGTAARCQDRSALPCEWAAAAGCLSSPAQAGKKKGVRVTRR